MTGNGRESLEIRVSNLARVEGEGGVYLKVSGGRVEYVEVHIHEAPRFFEAILKGRHYLEVPDITARICGICPLAYVMSSSRAMEKILGIKPHEEVFKLRRIAYLGEWIESHVLHIALLHAPDFLGYDSALQMVEEHGDFIRDSLKLKAWGNRVLEVVGGRPVHPVVFRVGGTYRIIRRDELLPLLKRVEEMKRRARRVLEFVANLPMPEFRQDITYVSLRNDVRYPILEGDVVTSDGERFKEEDFEKHVEVEQAKYSNSLRYRLSGGRPYCVGPLARFNLNHDLLAPEVKDKLAELGIKAPLKNAFQSIIARAAEVYHAVVELDELITSYREPPQPYVEGEVREGEAAAITEAPRGMLYHRYRIDSEGFVRYANIVAPTCQNYVAMEEDIRRLAPNLLTMPREKAQWVVEQAIRNYDPCISCSVHFIRLHIIND